MSSGNSNEQEQVQGPQPSESSNNKNLDINELPLNEVYWQMLDLKIAGRNRKQPLSQDEQTRFEALNARLQAAYDETLAANPGRQLEAEGQSFCRVCASPMLLPTWEGYAICSKPGCSWLGKVFYPASFMKILNAEAGVQPGKGTGNDGDDEDEW